MPQKSTHLTSRRSGLGQTTRTVQVGTFGSRSIPEGESRSYSFTVAEGGSIEPGSTFNPHDEIQGRTAEGKVFAPGGHDEYRVTGEIISRSLPSELALRTVGGSDQGSQNGSGGSGSESNGGSGSQTNGGTDSQTNGGSGSQTDSETSENGGGESNGDMVTTNGGQNQMIAGVPNSVLYIGGAAGIAVLAATFLGGSGQNGQGSQTR